MPSHANHNILARGGGFPLLISCADCSAEKASYLVWKKAHIVLKASILLRTYKQTHPLTYLTNELSLFEVKVGLKRHTRAGCWISL